LKSDRPKGRRLPANHAFVVQLSREARGTRDSFRGRAEHVVSGRAAHFETLDELLAFIRQALARLREPDKAGEGNEKA
jgi:hypothetical protein